LVIILTLSSAAQGDLVYDTGEWRTIKGDGAAFRSIAFSMYRVLPEEIIVPPEEWTPYHSFEIIPWNVTDPEEFCETIQCYENDPPIFPGNIYRLDSFTAANYGVDWDAMTGAWDTMLDPNADPPQWAVSIGLSCEYLDWPGECGSDGRVLNANIVPPHTGSLTAVEIEINDIDYWNSGDVYVIQVRVYAETIPEPSVAILLLIALCVSVGQRSLFHRHR
jgi:hypothetical protein